MEDVLLDRMAVQQMFAEDPFQPRLVQKVVPDALGVDDRDRSAAADAETAAQHAAHAMGVAEAFDAKAPGQTVEGKLKLLRLGTRRAIARCAEKKLACIGSQDGGGLWFALIGHPGGSIKQRVVVVQHSTGELSLCQLTWARALW
ncbi:MAG: hypothetical protein HC802_16090 [Caldilineaceae bacterium]|nr:hypothetical protein [Caldilineaceae bacterium]